MNAGDFQPGDQVIYLPPHAKGDPHHEDCERGFVLKVRGEVVFVKYFFKEKALPLSLQGKDCLLLRTVSNSEATMPVDLVKEAYTDPSVILKAVLKNLEALSA